MEEIDQINKDLNINETVRSSIEIKYRPAKFFRRIMANLFDFIIFVIAFIALFLASRAIVVRTDNYKEAFFHYRSAQLDSGLYVDNKSSSYPSVTNYIDNNGNYTHEGKHHKAQSAVTFFYTYIVSENDDEIRDIVTSSYQTYFSNPDLTDDKGNRFITEITFAGDSVTIIENSEANIMDIAYYNDVYKPFIDNTLIAYFNNYSSEYRINFNYVAKLLILIAVPISFVLAGVLVYLVPTLCFRRGRMTLGKYLYHIGALDSRYLNLTYKRCLARFAINFIFILTLSIFTFAVPIIISFTMMAFSKNKQSFTDYMLRIREVDTTNDKIYLSMEEIRLMGVKPYHNHVDFKPEQKL